MNEAIRIFKNSKMFENVILIDILDLEVDREEKFDNYTKLYNKDTLVGINVFDDLLAKEFEEGFNYPTEATLAILNIYFKEKLFTYDKDAHLRVGKILSFEPLKNSDKLNLCEVLVNEDKYSIVCGAANVYSGMKTIVALDNALLPTGAKINAGEVFGVASDGMLCSKRELGFIQSDEEKGIIDLLEDEEVNQSFFDVDWRKYNV